LGKPFDPGLASRLHRNEAVLGAHNPVAELFFTLAQVITDLLLIVTEVGGDLAADVAQPFEAVVVRLGDGLVFMTLLSSLMLRPTWQSRATSNAGAARSPGTE
jgi:hypothetical protein